jgi:hypothetical protein
LLQLVESPEEKLKMPDPGRIAKFKKYEAQYLELMDSYEKDKEGFGYVLNPDLIPKYLVE